ncbi:MAG: hypothetical protein IPP69_00265 [Flavobacteriales bacterium]|nr:hypothetical protein [Flavobacteriales bacterium]
MMKTLLISISLMLLSVLAYSEVVVISGIYQGKDLYVKNPITTSGIGYCIFEVLVNGNITSDEVNSPAFAVDLAVWSLKQGEPVEIVLRCKENCDVKIINPEVIYPNSTFEVATMDLTPDGLLTWSTTKESSSIPYIVEQFRWNRWIKVGEVIGLGKPEENKYSFQAKLHSGQNTFRVYQLDYKGQRTSQEIKVTSNTKEVLIKNNRVSSSIDFSEETDYEIYSEYGALVKAGRGSTVDASKFFKGKYYVSFDNKGGIIVEKK